MNSDSSKKIRAVIVEDEDLARQILREVLQPHAEVEIVAECANGFDAVKIVPELKPDLLFLDVQMPKLDGFEVLELLGNTDAMAVIFVTAYDQHALRAFDPKNFLRIHRSYLVNLERVSKLEPYTKDSHIAILHDGTRLPVSRAGYGRLRAVLER